MARRADIDPTDIPKLLPHVMLVEVLPSARYRYRLIGTENAEAHGMNATGRYLDEVLPGPEYKAHVLGLYDECVRSRRAPYSECLFISLQLRAPERHTKVLFLPLSEEGETVNQVFVVQVFFYIDQGNASAALHRSEALYGNRSRPAVRPGAALAPRRRFSARRPACS